MEAILVGTGGVFGALTRFYLGRYIAVRVNSDFPFGTLIINLTGAFVLSFLTFFQPFNISPYHESLKYLIMTGFLGAYTTFSTFSYESYQILKSRDYQNLIKYILGTIGIGLLAAYAGMIAAMKI